MPDYAVVKNLCEELNVSVSELMDGEETDDKSIRMYDEEQILDLLRRTQELEKQKVMLTGVVLIVMGVAFQSLSHTLGGSDVKDFFWASAGAVCRRNASRYLCDRQGRKRHIVFSYVIVYAASLPLYFTAEQDILCRKMASGGKES